MHFNSRSRALSGGAPYRQARSEQESLHGSNPCNAPLPAPAPGTADTGLGFTRATRCAGAYPCGPQALVDEMSRSFGTMRDSRDGATCESLVHNHIFAIFQRMYAAAKAGDAVALRKAHNNFASALLVPYIQARSFLATPGPVWWLQQRCS